MISRLGHQDDLQCDDGPAMWESSPMPTTDPDPIQTMLETVDLTFRHQLEARAEHPEIGNRAFLRTREEDWTYRRFRDTACALSHFLIERTGGVNAERQGRVAILADNHPEFVAVFGACGIGGINLFGINTGLRGETLCGVLNQSGASVLVVDPVYLPRVEQIVDDLTIDRSNIFLLTRADGADGDLWNHIDITEPNALVLPDVEVTPETPLMVIYSSGTTGLPKGINNNHLKFLSAGLFIASQVELGADGVGYACMPLFHSNSMFMALMPAFYAGATLAVRERFSASGFVDDVLDMGVTYWNYVGEPAHYILESISSRWGGDTDAIRRELTDNPRNRLRVTMGNGASPPDIDAMIDWFGLDDMHEFYGSTEAAMSVVRKKSDPRGSVGEIMDQAVMILDADGTQCPPAEVDGDGRILNYDQAVGEICRVAPEAGLFQGYFDNDDATDSKFRDGVYRSGDLGHVLIVDEIRYLFFDGRTDDWIRKDGENFSAFQVALEVAKHPEVALAAAYGAPCPVSDEWLMAAVLLEDGCQFDPQGFFDFCERMCSDGAMDRKWIPDFVRVVEDFSFTETKKILVRDLKRSHYSPIYTDDPVFWRRRGDSAYRQLTQDDYELLRTEFEAAERLNILEPRPAQASRTTTPLEQT